MNLLEGLLALGIVSLLTFSTLGVWQVNLRDHRQKALTHEMFQSLNFARQMALSIGRKLIFCGSSDGVQCDGQWNVGWVLAEMGGKILRDYQHHNTGLQIHFLSNRQTQTIVFDEMGMTQGMQGSFYICPVQGSGPICDRLVMMLTGRVRVESKVSIPF